MLRNQYMDDMDEMYFDVSKADRDAVIASIAKAKHKKSTTLASFCPITVSSEPKEDDSMLDDLSDVCWSDDSWGAGRNEVVDFFDGELGKFVELSSHEPGCIDDIPANHGVYVGETTYVWKIVSYFIVAG